MTTLTELIRQEAELNNKLERLTAEYNRKVGELQTQLAEVKRLREMVAAGVDVDKIRLGETVVRIYGDAHTQVLSVWGEVSCPRLKVVDDAIYDLAVNGGKYLRQYYFGIKNYAGFGDQRSDHYYGRGPKHGRIVFSVSLLIRDRDLTPEEIEAAVYLLEQVKAKRYVAPAEKR